MKKIKIHYFQHVAFETPGYIEIWANQNKHTLSATKFYELNYQLPNLNELDWLVVMGGPMSVNDEHLFNWLAAEKQIIKSAIQANKTVIGICLGAQLIASVLGAEVYKNSKKEIGWFPLTKNSIGKKQPLFSEIPDNFTAFHWHGDTFTIPTDAVNVFESDICTNQAFIYESRILGIQFHLEVTPFLISEFIKYGQSELVKDTYIQTDNEIIEKIDLCETSNTYLSSILTKFLEISNNPTIK